MDPIEMMVTDLNSEYLGLSRLCLMESAGKSLSDEIAKIVTFNFSKPVKIAIFTGSGGNAGDGFVAARYLLNRGFEVEIFMLSKQENLKSDNAKTNFEILTNMEPRISRLKTHVIETNDDVNNLKLNCEEYIIVDAILGTGIEGKLKTKVKNVIELINKSNSFIVSADIPSGLDPLTGETKDIAIIPNYTITFHRIKTGVKKAGEDKVGGIVTCDIGIPIEAEYFTGFGDLIKLNHRGIYSHKGNNGKLLIVGGSKDYSGAPAIAGLAAISSGSDLVYVTSPDPASLAIKATSPDLIVKGLKGDYLTLDNLDEILEYVDKVDAVLIGPGASLNEETGKLFNVLVNKIKKPLVLDADALKLVDLSLIKDREDIILTPHLFEFKRFFSKVMDEEEINSNNLELSLDTYDYDKINENISIFQSIVSSIKGTVIIKGQFDLVVNSKRFKINKTGNPGMTVGGTGDALSGLTTSLLSQGLNAFDSATLAIYLNGRAGDLAMNKQGYGFSATDITDYIGALMANIIK
ncbi:NAD(P)H-hydrate dehydratase [Methanobrevibacter sp. OttesenSCG-928-K11]|nr:NAD(P)H-hydrate dehydratase [Methanobrevibacter sp. OttesenSCG-928-K11]MDL2270824.1 NAD(P)H-hydrate dehydratase [Methanobrevibacter sp. OttesenSCG-928-I08]